MLRLDEAFFAKFAALCHVALQKIDAFLAVKNTFSFSLNFNVNKKKLALQKLHSYLETLVNRAGVNADGVC